MSQKPQCIKGRHENTTQRNCKKVKYAQPLNTVYFQRIKPLYSQFQYLIPNACEERHQAQFLSWITFSFIGLHISNFRRTNYRNGKVCSNKHVLNISERISLQHWSLQGIMSVSLVEVSIIPCVRWSMVTRNCCCQRKLLDLCVAKMCNKISCT